MAKTSPCPLCGGRRTRKDIAAKRVCESCRNAHKRATLKRVHRLISLGDDLTKCDPPAGVGWSQVRQLAGQLFGNHRTDKGLLDRVVGHIESDTGKIREAVFVMSLADVADMLKRSLSEEIAPTGKGVNAPDGSDVDSIPDDAYLSPKAIAEKFDLKPDALRQRLDRWREKNKGSTDWIENTERKPNEPKYTYRFGAIKHIVKKILKTTSGTTSKRPAAKS